MRVLHLTEPAERIVEGPPAPVWGIGVVVLLMGLLIVTLIFGKGRPHALSRYRRYLVAGG